MRDQSICFYQSKEPDNPPWEKRSRKIKQKKGPAGAAVECSLACENGWAYSYKVPIDVREGCRAANGCARRDACSESNDEKRGKI